METVHVSSPGFSSQPALGQIMRPLRELFTNAASLDSRSGPRAMRTGGWQQRRREMGFGEGNVDADLWEMERMGRRGL